MEVSLNTGSYSFKQWRKKNPADMYPDRGFTKQLKALDKELDVLWNFLGSKWEIWRFPEFGEPHHVLTVETKNKTYRELGADILLRLQQIDSSRYTLNEMLAYFDEMDNQVQRRKEKEFRAAMMDRFDEVWKFHWRPGGMGAGEIPIRIQVPQKYRVRRVLTDADG